MKKNNIFIKISLKITFLVVSLIPFNLQAQSLEIIPQVNYTFGGRIYARNGELKIRNSESYGLSLDLAKKEVSFQVEYFYQPTLGDYRDYLDPTANQSSNLNVSWYQIGVRKRFMASDKIVPFAGVSIGLTHFILNTSPRRYDEASLSFSLQGGANIYLSNRLGIRLHGRLMAPVQFNGFGFYVGTGGTGVGANASSYFLQADFGAGLVIRLTKK